VCLCQCVCVSLCVCLCVTLITAIDFTITEIQDAVTWTAEVFDDFMSHDESVNVDDAIIETEVSDNALATYRGDVSESAIASWSEADAIAEEELNLIVNEFQNDIIEIVDQTLEVANDFSEFTQSITIEAGEILRNNEDEILLIGFGMPGGQQILGVLAVAGVVDSPGVIIADQLEPYVSEGVMEYLLVAGTGGVTVAGDPTVGRFHLPGFEGVAKGLGFYSLVQDFRILAENVFSEGYTDLDNVNYGAIIVTDVVGIFFLGRAKYLSVGAKLVDLLSEDLAIIYHPNNEVENN